MARRRLWALALLPLLLAPAGCGLVDDPGRVAGSLFDKAAIDGALDATSDALREIPGVTDVQTSAELGADYTYQVTLQAEADALDPSGVRTALGVLSEGLADPVFTRHTVWASVGGLLSMSVFDLDETFMDEVAAYRGAVATAIDGPVALSIDPDETGAPRAVLSTWGAETVDWAALRAVERPSVVAADWQFGAVAGRGELPPPAVTDYLATVADTLPPRDDETFYEPWSAVWLDGAVELSVMSVDTFDQPGDSPQLPALAAAITAAQAAGIPLRTVAFWVSNSSVATGGTVTLAGCRVDPAPDPGSEALVDALRAAGAALPDITVAGYCPS